ncbi:hypothetical protein JK364_51735 [Streptomyces sp. 110]|uniref:Integral membrane protein n=1 Tax=Streptomyces endocoffeicus TaxID=2898945 RepID=A0ABS1Q7P3_9ACTN|nr:hypothetical protein [Streptomyces endocoffeicus]MBL1120679.1 hypothetical protein [Streptomyces endocoffeicus]
MPPGKTFDIRRLIAGLLGLYGAVLTVLGLTDGPAEVAKADGIRINLWIGLGLLAVATAFAAWARLAPAGREDR